MERLTTCQMLPTAGLLTLFTSFPSCSWSLCSQLSQASSRVLDLRRLGQHSASHLSDRFLPPKQWIIVVLHLSGGTHLVWSAAFFLLFLVMTWHLQPAYPAPFLGMAHRYFVSLWLYLSVSVSFPENPSHPPTPHRFLSLLSHSLTKSPKSNEQADYVREERAKKGKRMFYHQGNKGEE